MNPASHKDIEAFLQQKGLTAHTIARTGREVNKYTSWLWAEAGRCPENATKKDLINYLTHIKQSRKLCNATQNHVLQMLKNYYVYLAQDQGIKNIAHFIKIRGADRQYLSPILTAQELDLLVDAYYNHTQQYKPSTQELRFYADQSKLLQGRYIALTLMVYQGLHTGEVLRLTASDFDLRRATVNIRQSRTAAGRTLALEAVQIGALIQYFAPGTDAPLLPNVYHFEHLSQTLKTLLPKYQDFRHIRTSRITIWLKLHGLRKTQHLAGHRNITSTEKYIAGDFESLQNDLNSYHPLK